MPAGSPGQLHLAFFRLCGRGWSGGAMVLGKLPVPGRPTIWIIVGQGPTALAVGAGRGCLDIFTLICPFSSLSPSLWETARYRLKYCLKGPLNTKQPTNCAGWVGWCDGPGQTSSAGASYILDSRQEPIALAVGADGVVWTFLLSSVLSLLFLPLFRRRPDKD